VALALGVENSAPESVAVAPASADLVVRSLWVALSEIGVTECDTGPAMVLDDPTALDLVAGPIAGRRFALPRGRFCGITLRIEALPAPAASGAPVELETSSLFMTGNRTDGAKFEAWTDILEYDEVTAPGPDPASLIVQMDLGTLVPALDFDSRAVDTDGVVRLDLTTSSGEQPAFQALVTTSFRVYEDLNGNGQVDAEDSPI
jgi:hypothetical protein